MGIKNNNAEEQIDEVVRELRDAPPFHYLFKIHNYSLILNAKLDNYELTDSEVGGYIWRLAIYPKGNKKVNENEHISMYLKLSPSNALPLGQDVNVYFKFFVYNQILDKYMAIYDGVVRRFRGTKNEWGFDKLLPLNVFNDASKGYLVSDCCIFGAEIFVAPSDKGERWFVMKDLTDRNIFTWKVRNFSKLSRDCFKSETFFIGGHKWTLDLYPHGNSEEKGKSLSMYLPLEDNRVFDSKEVLEATFILRIQNQIDRKEDCEGSDKHKFCASSTNWGFDDLISLRYLNESSDGYISRDGNVIVQVEILSLTLVKDLNFS